MQIQKEIVQVGQQNIFNTSCNPLHKKFTLNPDQVQQNKGHGEQGRNVFYLFFNFFFSTHNSHGLNSSTTISGINRAGHSVLFPRIYSNRLPFFHPGSLSLNLYFLRFDNRRIDSWINIKKVVQYF